MATPQRRREHLLLPLLVAAVAVGVLLWRMRNESDVAVQRVHYEDLALADLRRLAAAQAAFHERHARYAWLEELQEAGLTTGIRIETQEGRLRAVASRYRIDVLLPYALTAGDLIRIGPRSAGQEDPDLQRRHFAVVARPWGEDLTGFRTFYLDENGNVFVSEGVSDVASRARRPLPDLHLSHGRLPDSYLPSEVAGLRFYALDRLPPR